MYVYVYVVYSNPESFKKENTEPPYPKRSLPQHPWACGCRFLRASSTSVSLSRDVSNSAIKSSTFRHKTEELPQWHLHQCPRPHFEPPPGSIATGRHWHWPCHGCPQCLGFHASTCQSTACTLHQELTQVLTSPSVNLPRNICRLKEKLLLGFHVFFS